MIELGPLHRRRRTSRRMARVPCSAIRLADWKDVGHGILDLSPGGALLRSDAELSIGDRVLVSFYVPGTDEIVDAPAEVARIIKGVRSSDRGRGVGLRFLDLHPTEVKAIGDGISKIPPVIPGRRRAIDYASAVRTIGSMLL